jgi:hypothetical protein
MEPAEIDLLRDPRAYPHPVGDGVRVIQTHISWVLLAGEYAYKIKKPVRFGFLDYSTPPLRRTMCEREVALNRRACDGVYLDVVAVVARRGQLAFHGDGDVVEHAVKMWRLPEASWLSARVATGGATPDLLYDVARAVHAFHTRAESSPEIARFGTPDTVMAIWRENLDELAEFAGDTVDRTDLPRLAAYADRFLAQARDVIAGRAATGRVRDGHGDLRSDSIVIRDDGGVCLADCIEFNDRLRCSDIAGDVGFLSMDLDARGHPELSDAFAGRYVELAWDDETLSYVLPFYRCYRALVRAKVESITAREREAAADEAAAARQRAHRHMALARQYTLADEGPCLLVVGGLSGTGKSHIAAALAARIGAVLIRSDAVRRALFAGVTPAYDAAARARVYREMRQRAKEHLHARRTVVLDATHIERAERTSARAVAEAASVPMLLIWVDAPDEIIRSRLLRRDAGDVSDARWETYVRQRERSEPPDSGELAAGVALDGAANASDNIARICAALTNLR